MPLADLKQAATTPHSSAPSGPLREKWDRNRAEAKLVSPKNKRQFHVLVVGSGLAGASAAATMAELGYRVSCFCFHDGCDGHPRQYLGLCFIGAKDIA